jgi:hypothetical protein
MSHSSAQCERRRFVQVVTCVLGVAIFALIHFIGSFALRISLGFSDTIEDLGETTVLWEAGRILLLILWFPAMQISDASRINDWVILIGNSILWGAGLFMVFLAALRLAGVQPINWSGQFSMRSLLVAITAAAIVLGLIGVAIQNLG